ncbi:MAG: DeoR/GlpR transcriptional regulator [Propionibacteriales bacterium]|nr:DeoR/GlpR transcriptional regulator [Propionibacteriales bacterium]
MYAEERQSAIADLVTRDRRLRVSETAESFGVTTETVRRDLAILERQGVIHRVHGGAVPADVLTTLEPAVAERDLAAAPQKDRIARAAVALLPGSGGSLILDGGTTTGRLARLLPLDRPLTVVTNAAPIAAIITGRSHQADRVELHILGGRVRPESEVAVGGAALAALADLRVDVSFIGVNGFTLDHGLHTPNHEEAAVKSAMIRAGRRVVVLTDSRKFGQESLVRFGRLEQIDAIVTDDGIDDADASALEALDIDVVIA